MRTLTAALLLLGSLAALAAVPGAAASACTTTAPCIGFCALRSTQCDNQGDQGNNLCVFDSVPRLAVCVPYHDCPPNFGCHPHFGVGIEVICDPSLRCEVNPTT